MILTLHKKDLNYNTMPADKQLIICVRLRNFMLLTIKRIYMTKFKKVQIVNRIILIHFLKINSYYSSMHYTI